MGCGRAIDTKMDTKQEKGNPRLRYAAFLFGVPNGIRPVVTAALGFTIQGMALVAKGVPSSHLSSQQNALALRR